MSLITAKHTRGNARDNVIQNCSVKNSRSLKIWILTSPFNSHVTSIKSLNFSKGKFSLLSMRMSALLSKNMITEKIK